jgi:hypothetical protein
VSGENKVVNAVVAEATARVPNVTPVGVQIPTTDLPPGAPLPAEPQGLDRPTISAQTTIPKVVEAYRALARNS